MTTRINLGLAFAALAGLVITAAGCRGESATHAAQSEQAAIPALIRQVGKPEMIELSLSAVPGARFSTVREVELPGVLETTGQVSFDDRRVSTIVSRVQGRIEQTRVSLWDNVHRGEPIVSLYSPDFMTAEAELLQAATTAKLTGKPEMTGGVNLAESLVTAAKRKLELLGMDDADIAAIKAPAPVVWMRAPIGGTVVEKKAIRGGAVNPGDELYSLGTLEDVWITGDIYEDDLARIHVGQNLDAVTTAYPNDVFHGVIARISPGVDPNTHTLQIRCEVKNPGLKLKPQMLARVKIVTRPGSALVVEQDALIFETNGYYAFVDAGANRIERREVAIGSWSEKGYARVIAGLKPGDRVITGQTIQVNALWHEAHGESS